MTTQPAEIPITTANRSRLGAFARGLRELALHAVVQDRVWQRLYPGVMHFLIFSGVTIQLLGTIINLFQEDLFIPSLVISFPRGASYLWFELVMDVAGGMILLGVLLAFIRRSIWRPTYLVTQWDDWYALALLTLVPVVGFFSEAFRLISVQPSWRAWSPIGNVLARGLTALGITETTVSTWHPYLFWAHVILGLLFVASIPFTKLRHLISGPLNILVRPQREAGALEPIKDIEEAEKLGVVEISEFKPQSLLSFDACVQCGRCEDVCPATISGMDYSPRKIIRDLQETLHRTLVWGANDQSGLILGAAIEKDTPWLCTTCGACMTTCPMFINPVDSVLELRRYLTLTTGEVPGEIGETLMNMERRGNPWGLPPDGRAPWVKELDLRVLQPGEETDVLLYLGCAFSYDTRMQKAGQALARLLQASEVDFAVLGSNEGCCGETARRLGHEYLFQVMAQDNIAAFDACDFQRIVTPCAHCFNTLKNEYPQFGGNYTVIHHTELLAELAQRGRLDFMANTDEAMFSYHDSCYLGRYNQIYKQPRQLLDRIPGLDRSEMSRRLANSFCCGGGGGQMWLEVDPNTRINHRRLIEAVEDAKADVLVTACPYCLIMFEDALRAKGMTEQVSIKDIAEVLIDHQSDTKV